MDIALSPPGFDTNFFHRFTWMTAKLTVFISPCGYIFYECDLCCCQFPAREYKPSVYRYHLVQQHLKFLAYRCHAAAAATTRAEEHRHHPALLGTVMTDSMVSDHQTGSLLLRKKSLPVGTTKDHVFPYVDVTIVTDDSHLFICSFCNFDSDSLETYKKHVALKHVTVERAPIPLIIPPADALERVGLSVYGKPPPPPPPPPPVKL